MDNQLLTISLLLIIACNLGMLLLYLRIERWMQTPTEINSLLMEVEGKLRLVLNRLSAAAERQRGMKQALLADGKKTRKETQEIKTRLTWSRKRELKDARQEQP